VTALDANAGTTRARVIDAAIECILDEGLYRASSNRIAKRAGVSWGVIQHHFGSREALLREAFQEGMSELIDLLESAVITGASFDARVESFADIIWRFYRQRRFVAYEQLTLNLLSDPTVDAATVGLVRRRQAKIGKLLNGLARQVVDDDDIAEVLPPAALLQILRGLAIGLVLGEAAQAKRRRTDGDAATTEREVLLAALGALVRDSLPRESSVEHTRDRTRARLGRRPD
jgi:AcrR family transcriptional regulator